jgi:hypothetical protein
MFVDNIRYNSNVSVALGDSLGVYFYNSGQWGVDPVVAFAFHLIELMKKKYFFLPKVESKLKFLIK